MVIGIYAGLQFFISFLMRIPACHRITNRCDRWPLVRFIKWMHQVSIFIFTSLFVHNVKHVINQHFIELLPLFCVVVFLYV